MNTKNSKYNELRADLYCKFCNKQCKNLNSLNNHERLCKNNPNRDSIITVDHKGKNNPMYGKKAWNKGLSKETSTKIQKMAETYTVNHKLGKHKKPIINEEVNDIRKEKLSLIAKNENNFWKYRRKHLKIYNGFTFDSSYEISVVESLDKNNVLWEKPTGFHYIDDNNVKHYYTPDIYLPEYDVYLDPKNDFLINNINPNLGYRDVDKIKWVNEQNNIKVIILDKNNLSWENIKKLI